MEFPKSSTLIVNNLYKKGYLKNFVSQKLRDTLFSGSLFPSISSLSSYLKKMKGAVLDNSGNSH